MSLQSENHPERVPSRSEANEPGLPEQPAGSPKSLPERDAISIARESGEREQLEAALSDAIGREDSAYAEALVAWAHVVAAGDETLAPSSQLFSELGRLSNQPAVESVYLNDLLTHKSGLMRSEACHSLRQSNNLRLSQAMLELLKTDTEAEVLNTATRVLCHQKYEQAIPTLIERAYQQHQYNQDIARNFGHLDSAEIRAFMHTCVAKGQTHCGAKEAAEWIVKHPSEAGLKALESGAAQEHNLDSLAPCAQALASIGTPQAISRLIKALQSSFSIYHSGLPPEVYTGESLLRSIRNIGFRAIERVRNNPEGEPIRHLMSELSGPMTIPLSDLALQALLDSGDQKALEFLEHQLTSPGFIYSPRGALNGWKARRRVAIAKVLQESDRPEVYVMLRKAERDDPSEGVRRSARDSMATIDGRRKEKQAA